MVGLIFLVGTRVEPRSSRLQRMMRRSWFEDQSRAQMLALSTAAERKAPALFHVPLPSNRISVIMCSYVQFVFIINDPFLAIIYL